MKTQAYLQTELSMLQKYEQFSIRRKKKWYS